MTNVIADDVTIAGVRMTLQAARLVEFCGINVAVDVERVRRDGNCHGLLADCLDGCEDADDADGWRDYVSAVCAAADDADEDDAWTYEAYCASVLGQPAARVVAEYELTTQPCEIRTWLDRAQVAAWAADGDGGPMPAEWVDCYFEDAAAALYEAALTAEKDAAVCARAAAEVAS